jgi:tetratricopeptide (TPR) repeat protein
LAKRQGNVQQLVWGFNLLALYELRTAETPDGALNYLLSSKDIMGEGATGLTFELYLGWLAEIYLRLGEFDKAGETADQIGELLGKSPPFSHPKLVSYSAQAKTYLTLWEQAGKGAEKELVKSARAACRALSRYGLIFPIGRPRSALCWGCNHWLSGRKIVARYYWRKALVQAETLDMPYEAALAHFELGRHITADDPKRRYHLNQAGAIFKRLGATHDLLRCREAGAG